ncbi:MAG: 1,4-alpha-glucan-branching enzyme, partial [Rikenellaceae bacterium]|nr:1,4-alpha-glucan-branching enzyme [Rikenellaceae bacterium]
MEGNTLKIFEKDPWLRSHEGEIRARWDRYQARQREITQAAGSLADFANAHRFYGFHRDEEAGGWWFREWLPGAEQVFLFGDFNGWNRHQLPLGKGRNGVWSIFLADGHYALLHGMRAKMLVVGKNGTYERIPAYIRRVVQDDATKDFCGQLWIPDPFDWQDDNFDPRSIGTPYIYEAHVGMAQEKAGVGTYAEFAETILPRIKAQGYNAVQLMAIAEHPYYGSFGYHVSNFFAPSSRFGTPEELKELVRRAHESGLAVIMDIVHSHFVKNLNEGINELDGTDCLYSLPGAAGDNPYWDSKVFDYGKDPVQHFLLSNIKYWLDEFRFDGFRFDGVTSMLYHHHGYTEFDDPEKFFNADVNRPALVYLTLANELVHMVKPNAITIAEDVSGMPATCFPVVDGGVGFDYRLAMAIPDFWIELLEDIPDEQWDIWRIWDMMVNRLSGVGTITYCE